MLPWALGLVVVTEHLGAKETTATRHPPSQPLPVSPAAPNMVLASPGPLEIREGPGPPAQPPVQPGSGADGGSHPRSGTDSLWDSRGTTLGSALPFPSVSLRGASEEQAICAQGDAEVLLPLLSQDGAWGAPSIVFLHGLGHVTAPL